jgi:tRNA U34 2-thiouridine synthase MnmA/TrmU
LIEMGRKAVALFSGGLDSILAVKMMIDQGIKVTAINFTSPFDSCIPKSADCLNQAGKVAEELGVPIHVIPVGMDFLRIVENPPHGYGRGLNPCIDCRIYMLRKAKEMMPSLGASFVVTGEVLGQRPMSQRRQQIALIEKESGLEGLILRPLSAQNFPPTVPELEGKVDRQKLLAVTGRSRRAQIDLARDMSIKDYPAPAGGCLLTDSSFVLRLKDLFTYVPDYSFTDLHLLRIGRHFCIHPRLRIILGRNQEENERIARLASPGATLFLPEGFRGPTAVVRKGNDVEDETVGAIIARYCQDKHDAYLIKKQVLGGEESFFTVREKFPSEKLDAFRVG